VIGSRNDYRRTLVSQTAGHAEGQHAAAMRLGFEPGQVVQELGWDEDTDDELRAAIEDITRHELVDEEHEDVVDAVLLWWRDGDGDLVDALVDAKTDLADGGVIWLLTPKVGQLGHVDPSDISDAAPTAGLATTTSLTAASIWSGTKLVTPRTTRGSKR
jgi:Protein of unknown function (DUF3052)